MSFAQYTCGRCGGSVDKNARVCPHCGVRLGGIKCLHCGFIGSATDFPGDLCPKCGSHVVIPRRTSSSAGTHCSKCGSSQWDGLFCSNCGKVSWVFVIGLGGMGAFLLFGLVQLTNTGNQDTLVRLLLGGGGLFLLLFSIITLVRWFRFRQRKVK